MLDRLFRRKSQPLPLRGAPAIRRQKTYSAQTGYVYQYFYEGYRPGEHRDAPGNQHVFQVSSDRKSSFSLGVFLPAAVVESWQKGHGRELTTTEQYAAVKMALFEAFDERADLGASSGAIEVGAVALERHLATLEID